MPSISEAIVSLANAYPDMTLRQAAMLFYCAENANETERQVRELSVHFGWLRPVVSRAGIRLEEMELVRRGQIEGDKRTCTFTVTKGGYRAISKATGGILATVRTNIKRKGGKDGVALLAG